jgi:tetratricopeptide (TPR) repeat protein
MILLFTDRKEELFCVKKRRERCMRLDKQVPVASVAWYKLADLIARGEREKALNVYRLLAHSFDDKAYALQLEGDVLLALEDPRAKDKYYQAATLYKKEKRWVDAVALGEHLLAQHPEDPLALLFAVYCYAVLDVRAKVTEYFDQFKVVIKSRGIAEDFFTEELELLNALAKQKNWLAVLLDL